MLTRSNEMHEMKMVGLQASYNNLTEERDQLQTSFNNLTEERDQLQTSFNNLTEERDQLQNNYNQLVTALTNERNDLQRKVEDTEASLKDLTNEKEVLKSILKDFGWVYFRGSFYYVSSTKRTWDQSRDDCLQKGADLMIINGKEEQDFANRFQKYMWIGLTDSQREGTWKWVDGTLLTKSYWASGEPNGGTQENCGDIKKYDAEKSWNDESCSHSLYWVCEKKLLCDSSLSGLTAVDTRVQKSSLRAAAVILGLLCLLLLTGLITLVVMLTRSNEMHEMKMVGLQASYNNLTEERDQLQTSYNQLVEDTEASLKDLTNEKEVLKSILKDFGWVYFRGSFYYVSSTNKTWQQSRDDCLQKGADLMIINSKEEQDFANQFKKYMWIGLTDSQTEATWKWVDGTLLTKSYWASKEPNGGTQENCGDIKKYDAEKSWNDEDCSHSLYWVCEKKLPQ
ncbi:C-type mannose receptor 2-like [Pagrus major]|uniref:C-type mannose receptor 2-like n=1 Tax=Pagrus major TaxID=143350 RepID=UPI003CC86E56